MVPGARMSDDKKKIYVVYVAHPVAGDVEGNRQNVLIWIKWLQDNYPLVCVANWVNDIVLYDDAVPEQREAGMLRNLAVLERCEGVLLVGGRVSPGMARERDHAIAKGIPVSDLTELGKLPPEVLEDFIITVGRTESN